MKTRTKTPISQRFDLNVFLQRLMIFLMLVWFVIFLLMPMVMAEYATEYGIIGTGAVKNVPEGYSADPMSNLCDLDIEKAAEDRDSILAKFTPFLAGKEASS